MRTKKAAINIVFGSVAQLAVILLSFVSRKVFVAILGYEYLGLTSVFTSIVGMLSLLEMGAGTAVICALYQPLAEKDDRRAGALLLFSRKIYHIVALLIVIVGVLFIPFLKYLVQGAYPYQLLLPIYLLFIVDGATSYLFSYKKLLITADQNSYIIAIGTIVRNLAINIFQVLLLLYTGNYLLFLIVKIIVNLSENIICSKIIDNNYNLAPDSNQLLDKDKESVITNMKAIALHHLGNYIILNSGNLFISSSLGLTIAGVYSNYYLIMSSINNICIQFSSGVTASFGNLTHSEEQGKTRTVFYQVQMIGYFIYSFVTVSFYSLANSFLEIWLGAESLMPWYVPVLLSCYLFLSGISQPLGSLRAGTGLFKPDSKFHIVLSIGYVLFNLIFISRIGILSILLSQIVCCIVKDIIILPRIMYQKLFQESSKTYYLWIIKYTGLTACLCVVMALLRRITPSSDKVTSFLVMTALCMVVPNALNLLILCRTKQFKGIWEWVGILFFKQGKGTNS